MRALGIAIVMTFSSAGFAAEPAAGATTNAAEQAPAAPAAGESTGAAPKEVSAAEPKRKGHMERVVPTGSHMPHYEWVPDESDSSEPRATNVKDLGVTVVH